jgi:hypothetical protein
MVYSNTDAKGYVNFHELSSTHFVHLLLIVE